jgi:histidinol-phosphate aminotransferase
MAGVQGLHPYQPGKPISTLSREIGMDETEIIKLASNENPLGPSPMVVEAIKSYLTSAPSEQARYPDGGAILLRERLAAHHNCTPEQITVGNGSNDVLDLIARTFLGEGRASIFSEHAFAVYPLVTQAVGATAVVVPALDWGHDLTAMAAAVDETTRVVWVANPNNPTGNWVSREQLYKFLTNIPEQVVVVVDEAYIEFMQDRVNIDTAADIAADTVDSSKWLAEFPNLIVTRTFSKAYGLAGYRVGYSLSSERVAELLNRVRQPFNVNSLAQTAAVAALSDNSHIKRVVELNREEMAKFEYGFKQLNLKWIPSAGNFIAVDLGIEAAPIFRAMEQQGVITRPIANYGMPDHLRISIGLPEENRRCLSVLRGLL